jgi:hypothetical protein
MEVEFIGFSAKPDEYITGPLWMKNTASFLDLRRALSIRSCAAADRVASPTCGCERCVTDPLVQKW